MRKGKVLWVILAVVLIICLLMVAFVLRRTKRKRKIIGGFESKKKRIVSSAHVVVDTLNIAHWITGDKILTTDSIIETIDVVAPILRKSFSDRVMFVVKDREKTLNSSKERVIYSDCAKRNKIYIYCTEKYENQNEKQTEVLYGLDESSHSTKARDDFYMALLARKYKCAVITADRFDDFKLFRDKVEPFHVFEFAYWRSLPEREYVRPSSSAYARVKKPHTVKPSKFLKRIK